jgi:hypothetical protein
MQDLRAERLQIMLSPEELQVIDDFRYQHRMPTRAAAVRELLKMGLAAKGTDGAPKMKSSDYGVFGRGGDGHQDEAEESARHSEGTPRSPPFLAK